MSLAHSRAKALLSIRKVAREEAKRQAQGLFSDLKLAIESSVPCVCSLLDSELTEKLGIELSVELKFEDHNKMMETEEVVGDFLENNCQALIGWKRTVNNTYGFRAILLF